MASSQDLVEVQKLSPQEQAALEYKEEVLRLTNIERSKVGLAPLKALEGLDELAQVRAEEIKVLFSHTRPGGEKAKI